MSEVLLLSRRYEGLSEKWTKEEEEYLADNYKTMTDAEIARALGRGVSGIHIKRRGMGLLKRDEPEKTVAPLLYAKDIWERGRPCEVCGKEGVNREECRGCEELSKWHKVFLREFRAYFGKAEPFRGDEEVSV